MSFPYELVGYLAGIFGISGYFPYIRSILRGKTRPERSSWLIWSTIGGLLAFSYIGSGADLKTIWLPLCYFIGPLIPAFLSFKYGYAKWSLMNTICIVIAICSIAIWFFSKNANFTLIINMMVDATGAVPTLLKTYRDPETEDFTAWFLFFIANSLQMLAITTWNFAAIYPIYLFLLGSLMMLFLVRGKRGR